MSLKERLSNLTKEEFDEKWERLKHYNEIGPNVREYMKEIKEQDKELILQDLCPRLHYGVKAWEDDEYPPFTVIGYDGADFIDDDGWEHRIGEFKPYLRPLSSMTEEEFVCFMSIRGMNLRSYEIQEMMSENFSHPNSIAIVNTLGRYSHNIDWLDKNMFDYRGLIERGLAIDCTNLNVY